MHIFIFLHYRKYNIANNSNICIDISITKRYTSGIILPAEFISQTGDYTMPTFPDQPLYQKIKEDILRQIKDGQLLPGDKIPTEYQLMEKYGVSRITVSKALSELKS